MSPKNSTKKWRVQTNLVRGGTNRSDFSETNEAIFATSGYVYDSAEQAQRAFKNQEDRYIYSRFSSSLIVACSLDKLNVCINVCQYHTYVIVNSYS